MSLNPPDKNSEIGESAHEDDFSEEDLQKYMNQKANPSFCKQITAMAKRRLLTFLKSPKEIMLGVNPVLYCMLNLIMYTVIFDAILKAGDPSSEDAQKAKEVF